MYLPNKIFRSPQPALNLKDFPGPRASQVECKKLAQSLNKLLKFVLQYIFPILKTEKTQRPLKYVFFLKSM